MADFYGNNGQQTQKESTNTKGPQFYNPDDPMFPGTLVCSFWDNFIKFSVHPSKPVEQRTQSAVYDYNTTGSTAVTAEKALILLEGIKNRILPALEKGESASVGTVVGGSNQVAVVTNGQQVALVVYKNIDPVTKKPGSNFGYTFNTNVAIIDYDKNTGTHEMETVQSELNQFIVFLKESVKALTHAQAHSQAYSDRFRRPRNNQGENQNGYSRGNSWLGNTQAGNGQQGQQQSVPQQEQMSYDADLSALLG